MNILVWFMAGKYYGNGHMYRSLEVVRAARAAGHYVKVVSNVDIAVDTYIIPPSFNINVADVILEHTAFDWVILDVPTNRKAITNHLHKYHSVKVCILGADIDETYADLPWVIDHPSKALVRQHFINSSISEFTGADWYVYNSAPTTFDIAGLLGRALPNATMYIIDGSTGNGGFDTYKIMRACRNVCTYMGVTAWEAAALGKPMYLFSPSGYHLVYARSMQALGLARAYPIVGLPETPEKMAEFVSRPYEIDYSMTKQIDGKAADRLLEQMGSIRDGMYV